MLRLTAFFLLLMGTIATPAYAAGTPGAGEEPLEDGETPQSAAQAHYRQGLAYKETAWKHEQQAQAQSSSSLQNGELQNEELQNEELQQQARIAYQQAIKSYGKALKLYPQNYQAANELGYALRKTGNYRKALGAYNFALGIKPDFFEAVEYRGEAYLALGLLEKAKADYMTLFTNAPDLAAQLLTAMERQAAEGAPSAEGVSNTEGFSAWVNERKALAAIVIGTESEGWTAPGV